MSKYSYLVKPSEAYTESSPSNELVGTFRRPSWAPTPLNPHNLQKQVRRDGVLGLLGVNNHVPYISDARKTIDEVFERNLQHIDEVVPGYIKNQMEVLITSSLYQRFDRNDGKSIPENVDERTAELFKAACLGSASSSELIELLRLHPALKSIELAKLTHPFDWTGTKPMEDEMSRVLSAFPEVETYPSDSARLYVHGRHHEALDALEFVRKKPLGGVKTKDGMLHIMQRDSLLLDLNLRDHDDMKAELCNWLKIKFDQKNIKGAEKLLYDPSGNLTRSYIERHMSPAHEPYRDSGLYPAVRSYYAFVDSSEQ